MESTRRESELSHHNRLRFLISVTDLQIVIPASRKYLLQLFYIAKTRTITNNIILSLGHYQQVGVVSTVHTTSGNTRNLKEIYSHVKYTFLPTYLCKSSPRVIKVLQSRRR